MEIKKAYPANAEHDKKLVYKLCMGRTLNAKDMMGTTVKPTAWVLYEKEDMNGKNVEVLAIVDGNSGEAFSTISPTFKRDFSSIADLMDGEEYEISIVGGQSKAGREFVTCTMVCD